MKLFISINKYISWNSMLIQDILPKSLGLYLFIF